MPVSRPSQLRVRLAPARIPVGSRRTSCPQRLCAGESNQRSPMRPPDRRPAAAASYPLVVDEAAVGAAHVDEDECTARRHQQPRMIPTHCTGADADMARARAADRDDVASERNGVVGPIDGDQLRTVRGAASTMVAANVATSAAALREAACARQSAHGAAHPTAASRAAACCCRVSSRVPSRFSSARNAASSTPDGEVLDRRVADSSRSASHADGSELVSERLEIRSHGTVPSVSETAYTCVVATRCSHRDIRPRNADAPTNILLSAAAARS